MTHIVPTPLSIRLIKEIGTRATHRIYWTGECGTRGYHNGETPIGDSPKVSDWEFAGHLEGVHEGIPDKCDVCGEKPPIHASRQVFYRRLYDTPSGNPEPGICTSTTVHSTVSREKNVTTGITATGST